MKHFFRLSFVLLLSSVFFAGCASLETSVPNGSFVRDVDFPALETFSYEHTIVTGMVSRQSSQEMVMKELSEKVLHEELTGRGFGSVAEGGDFYVVTKWRKEINASAAEMVRFSLILELYESTTQKVFWRAELPYAFNAMQWSEQRVSDTLRQAIEGFPTFGAAN